MIWSGKVNLYTKSEEKNMKRNFVDAFSLWSSHRFSSQYNGCLTLWYVNNGWCFVNGKTTKTNK